MTESTSIVAKTREVTGKANRRLAAEGLIPAVLYGPARETVSLSLPRHDFELFLQHQSGSSGVVELVIDGESKPVNAMIRQIQTSPVKGTILHVDFMAIRMDRVVHTTVALHFVGDAAGVKEGGTMLHEAREANVEALPGDLPDFIEVDVSELQMGSTMTVADLVVPDAIRILDDPETVLCSVVTPISEEAEVAEGAEEEAAEPELIGETDTESEEG